ncbi:hypothetical protein EVJ58_g1450 [Rhodofomes roseus]|uniref:RNB domain-containing protein n=1 Tax=Rhodofomes roseus TaxID=34475 RepID=A0A4Y9YYL0_9APHY|nr:hypothetical protein EVJ58_g1450 [Rhodofomes roseus]
MVLLVSQTLRLPNPQALARKEAVSRDIRPGRDHCQGLVSAAAKKQNKAGWGHPQHYEGETRRLTEAVKSAANPHRIPTPELQTLLASQDLSFDPLSTENVARQQQLQPGAFVEIRRAESSQRGVVVQNIPENGVWTTYSLLSGGELWPHRHSDVMFYIPDFVDRDLVSRCGTKQASSLSEHEIAARVTVLKRLRNFEIAAEHSSKEMIYQLRDLYDKLRHPDPDKAATVTVEQAARLLIDGPQIPLLTRFAVHQYLFAKSRYFTAETFNFLARPVFAVRSKQDVQTIEAVDDMVARRDPVLDGFVEKAKVLVRAARKREQDTWSEPPSYQVDDSTTFTPAELTILRFFRIALRNNRMTQRDPFLPSLSYLSKRIGLYETDYGPRIAQPLLVELGVMPPWVDPVERVHMSAEENMSGGLALLSSRLTRDELSSSSANTSAARPAPSVPLGPEDFYSRDLADHLRHDFGNTPVYVIDDFDANELDDGISVERIPSEPEHAWLHVHVADPTSVLPPTHRIAREALGQMSSLYYLDGSIPMLPDLPQLRGLSLGKTGEQCVMTFSGKIDQEGNIVDYKVTPSIIRNAQKLRYNDVSEALGSPLGGIHFPFGGDESLFPRSNASSVGESAVDDLRFVQKITGTMVKARVRNGAMEYNWPTATVKIHSKSLPEVPPITNRPYRWSGFPKLSFRVEETRLQESGARGIVAESARMANRIASLWLRDRDIPAIRRVSHPHMETIPGGSQRLMEARDEHGFVDYSLIHQEVILGTVAYELTPGPHAVLGVADGEGYMRATSPLRRFLDIVTHWQIKHAMLTPDAPRLFPTEWLQNLADHANWWESRQKATLRSHTMYWSYKYLERWLVEHKEGSPEAEQFERSLVAVVTNVGLRNYYHQYWQSPCQIWNLGLKGNIIRLEPTAALKVGGRVHVKIDSIEPGITSSMSLVRR